MTRRFKYVQRWIDHLGRERIRFRRHGHPLIELPGPIGSEAFLSVYFDTLGWSREKKTSVRPTSGGVYLLLLGDEIVYIGASIDMNARVADHRTNCRPFDKAFLIRTKPSERQWLEQILIRAFEPRQNRRGVSILNSAPKNGDRQKGKVQ